MLRRLLLLLACSGICVASSADAAALRDPALAAGLKPHKALYSIEMIGKRSASQIVNVSGRMMYEWRADCSAWISDHRLDVAYEYADTPPMRVKSDFSTYETLDGKNMDFSAQRYRNGIMYEEVRGHAQLDEESHATYTIPEGLKQDLPEGTMFPMMHTLRVLEKMKAGKKFYKATVFDGSDDNGPIEINAFLGALANPQKYIAPAVTGLDEKLLSSPARKIRLAFFTPESEDASVPDYEMSLILHQNGVISDMVVEYDEFTVSQKLIALEKLDNTCAATAKRSQ